MGTGSNTNVVNIILPTSWQELSQLQYKYILKLLALGFNQQEIKAYCLLRFGRIEVITKTTGSTYIVKHGKRRVEIDLKDFVALQQSLAWMDEPPKFPIRLERVGRKGRAIAADFTGVPFEKFLYIDNLMQGYFYTQDDNLLSQMAELLYQCQDIKLEQFEKINILLWFASLKALLALNFPNFLRPADEANGNNLIEQPLARQLMDSMNAQLRALTKGDVTKEHIVRQLDTWRALTELDAIAKESQEINSKYGQK